MKHVKQIMIAVAVSVALLAGCGSGSGSQKDVVSNVTISEFESQVLEQIDSSRSISTKDVDNGKEFSASSPSDTTILWEITGQADKEEKIKSVKMVIPEADTDYFNKLTPEEIVDLASNGMGSLNRPKLRSVAGLGYFAYAVELFSDDSGADAWLNGMDLLLKARSSDQTNNGWKYSVNTSGETITYTAEYIGQ